MERRGRASRRVGEGGRTGRGRRTQTMHLSSVLSRRATADFACYYYFFNELATARAKTIPLGGGTPPPKSHPPHSHTHFSHPLSQHARMSPPAP